ncbi:MAG: lipid IV(A) 3-deoxy-D-manno-octulosonic acid transferase [Gammaproteobacteria bacterium]|nr:lipid IV(A) 3-deoxy-D-manno-octulosonic acid transferase [Gammaproteobacteria bacterium]
MLWRWGYRLLVTLLLPLVLLWFSWPRAGVPKVGRRLGEYLGGGTAVAGRPLWLHAASVGEVNALLPLLRAMRQRWPQLPLLVTTTSATGAERVAALAIDGLHHRFQPLDQPWVVARFIARHHPRSCLLTEMELWPELLLQLAAIGIPCGLVNARMSARSARGYGRLKPLLAPALASLSLVLTQSRAVSRRLHTLGVRPEALQQVGNLKFDLTIDDGLLARAANLRHSWGERPVWLAASTHDDEEAQLLQLHQRLRQQWPTLLLVLVPRHPQRFDAVAELVAQCDMRLARRSLGQPVDGQTAVYLGDTMGELLLLQGCADLVVVGGTFIDHGGQNPLEAAALGKPLLLGPSVYNFREAVTLLLAARAAHQCQRVSDLEQLFNQWLAEPHRAQQLGERGKAVVAANSGALGRSLQALELWLPAAPQE